MKKLMIVVMVLLSVSLLGAAENWIRHESTDEMTGESSLFVMAKSVPAISPMGFPYSDVEVILCIFVDADSAEDMIYLYFTKAPNLSDTDTEDGYYSITTRVKYDDLILNSRLTQEWSSHSLHFTQDKTVIDDIINSDEIIVELKWYGEGNVHFKIPVTGLAEMLESVRAELN